MQDWVFGCDICQDVCPVNSKSRPSSEPAFQRKDLGLLELTELLELSDEQFLAKFKGSPILRAKRTGLQRNACVALGNRQNPDAIPSLAIALATSDSLVRGHAAWALGCIGGRAAINALEQAYVKELEPEVLSEISAALKTLK
jgi:epoxyqueuosine reductase